MKIAVTGGSGKAGRAVVRDLREHGHEVLNVDRVPSHEDAAPYLPADLTDYGQTLEALSGGHVLPGIEAVVHLAAIPAPDKATQDVVFRTNITSTHTVFSAAWRLGLKRIVWASSETTLGLPFDTPPEYAPVDEEHPLRPESSYALSKVLGEEMARQFNRWTRDPDRRPALLERDGARGLPAVPVLLGRPAPAQVEPVGLRRRVARRAGVPARARGRHRGRGGVRHRGRGHRHADARAASSWPKVFPGVPVRDGVDGHDTLLGIDKARRMLGYAPGFSWRELF